MIKIFENKNLTLNSVFHTEKSIKYETGGEA